MSEKIKHIVAQDVLPLYTGFGKYFDIYTNVIDHQLIALLANESKWYKKLKGTHNKYTKTKKRNDLVLYKYEINCVTSY